MLRFSRSFRENFFENAGAKIFSKNRSRRRDQFGPKIVKIRAILAIFWPFEVLGCQKNRIFERLFTPRGWLRSAPNFGKTRFRRSPTFHLSTSKTFFWQNFFTLFVPKNFKKIIPENSKKDSKKTFFSLKKRILKNLNLRLHMITALSNITYKCSWIILNEFFEDFQPIETILKFYCIQNLEIFMKISPPHPNTTTNKIILWSKTFHSFSGMSLNMPAISWIFYEGLGVLGGWEIGFEVKKRYFYDIQINTPPG